MSIKRDLTGLYIGNFNTLNVNGDITENDGTGTFNNDVYINGNLYLGDASINYISLTEWLVDCQTYAGQAEAFKNQAETARDEAETARDDAETAKDEAETARDEAATSADEAAASAAEAATSAGESSAAAAEATAAAAEATAAADVATAAAVVSTAQAAAAANSASNAQSSSTAAASSATAAASSATAAANSATAAATSATEAATSATAAATSATSSASSATAAATSATAAAASEAAAEAVYDFIVDGAGGIHGNVMALQTLVNNNYGNIIALQTFTTNTYGNVIALQTATNGITFDGDNTTSVSNNMNIQGNVNIQFTGYGTEWIYGFANDAQYGLGNPWRGHIKYISPVGSLYGATDRMDIRIHTIGTPESSTFIRLQNRSIYDITNGATQGYIGICTETPNYTLDISGDIYISGDIINGSTTLTPTEFSYLDGLTSNAQTQLTSQQTQITTLQTKTQNITATDAITTISDSVIMSGDLQALTVTATETIKNTGFIAGAGVKDQLIQSPSFLFSSIYDCAYIELYPYYKEKIYFTTSIASVVQRGTIENDAYTNSTFSLTLGEGLTFNINKNGVLWKSYSYTGDYITKSYTVTEDYYLSQFFKAFVIEFQPDYSSTTDLYEIFIYQTYQNWAFCSNTFLSTQVNYFAGSVVFNSADGTGFLARSFTMQIDPSNSTTITSGSIECNSAYVYSLKVSDEIWVGSENLTDNIVLLKTVTQDLSRNDTTLQVNSTNLYVPNSLNMTATTSTMTVKNDANADVAIPMSKMSYMSNVSSDIQTQITTANTNIAAIQVVNTSQSASIAAIQTVNTSQATSITTANTNITALQSSRDAVYGNVISLQSSRDAVYGNVIALQTSRNAIYGNVISLQSSRDAVYGNVISLQSSMTTANTNIAAIQVINTSQSASIAAIEAVNTSQATSITTANTNIAAIQVVNTSQAASIAAIEAVNTSQATSISAIEAVIPSLNISIGAIQVVNTNQAASISAIEAVNTSQGTSITALQSSRDAVYGNVISLQSSMTTANTNIAAIQAVNTSQATSITAIEAVNTSQTTSITALQAARDAVYGNVISLQSSRDAVYGNVLLLQNKTINISYDNATQKTNIQGNLSLLNNVKISEAVTELDSTQLPDIVRTKAITVATGQYWDATLSNETYNIFNGLYNITFSLSRNGNSPGQPFVDDTNFYTAHTSSDADGYMSCYIDIELPTALVLDTYSFKHSLTLIPTLRIRDWTITATNNGTSWTTLDSQIEQDWNATTGIYPTYTIGSGVNNNITAYKRYRVTVSRMWGGPNYLRIFYWKLNFSQHKFIANPVSYFNNNVYYYGNNNIIGNIITNGTIITPTELSYIDGVTSNIQTQFTNVGTAQNAVYGNVIALQGSNTTANTNIIALQSSRDAVYGNVISLQSSMTTANTNIAAIQVVNTSQASSITAIEAVNTSQATSITALQSSRDAVYGNVISLQSSMTTANANIAAIQVVNTSQAASISAIEAVNTSQSASIATLVTNTEGITSDTITTNINNKVTTTFDVDVGGALTVNSSIEGLSLNTTQTIQNPGAILNVGVDQTIKANNTFSSTISCCDLVVYPYCKEIIYYNTSLCSYLQRNTESDYTNGTYTLSLGTGLTILIKKAGVDWKTYTYTDVNIAKQYTVTTYFALYQHFKSFTISFSPDYTDTKDTYKIYIYQTYQNEKFISNSNILTRGSFLAGSSSTVFHNADGTDYLAASISINMDSTKSTTILSGSLECNSVYAYSLKLSDELWVGTNNIADEIETLQTTSASMTTTVATIQTASNTATANIVSLQSASTTANTNIAAIEAVNTSQTSLINTANTNIAAIQVVNTSQAASIAAIEAVNTSQATSITTANTNISALQTARDAVYGNVVALQTARDAIYGNVVALQTARNAVYGNVLLLQSSRDAVYGNVLLLQSSRDAVYGNVMLLQNKTINIAYDNATQNTQIQGNLSLLSNVKISEAVTELDNTQLPNVERFTPNTGQSWETTLSNETYNIFNGLYKVTFSLSRTNNQQGQPFVDGSTLAYMYHNASDVSGYMSCYIDIELPTALVLDTYRFKHSLTINQTLRIRDWTITATNDGTTWTTLDSQIEQDWNATTGIYPTYTIGSGVNQNITFYKRYRVTATRMWVGSNYLRIYYWQLNFSQHKFIANPVSYFNNNVYYYGNNNIIGNIITNSATITPTELSYIDGVTSNIQTQFTNLGTSRDAIYGNVITLQGSMTTANTNITNLQSSMTTANTNITNLQTLTSNNYGNIIASQGSITTANTNITNLQSSMTTANTNISNLQTATTDITFITDTTTIDNNVVISTGKNLTLTNGNLIVNGVTLSPTELGYINGVSSKIQTQINTANTNITALQTATTDITFLTDTTTINNNVVISTGKNFTITNGTFTINASTINETAIAGLVGYTGSTIASRLTTLETSTGTATGSLTGITYTLGTDTTTIDNNVVISTGKNLTLTNGSFIVNGVTLTATELGYIDGVSSNIQTQINTANTNITTANTNIATANTNITNLQTTLTDITFLTDTTTINNNVVISTGKNLTLTNGSFIVNGVTLTATELGYIDGLTSNAQTQLTDLQTKTAYMTQPGGGYTSFTGQMALPVTTIENNQAMSATTGSLLIKHTTTGGTGQSCIVFPSKNNYGTDYGYIQYKDDYLGENGEKSVLIIGVENDSAGTVGDRIALMSSSGYVGINTTNPTVAMDVVGSIKASGIVYLEAGISVGGTTISNTELSYVDGLTSNCQTQLTNLQTTLTDITYTLGTDTTTINNNVIISTGKNLTITSGSFIVGSTTLTSTEIGYLDGLTSNAQTQLTDLQTKTQFVTNLGSGITQIAGYANLDYVKATYSFRSVPYYWVSGSTTVMNPIRHIVFTNGYDVYIPDVAEDGVIINIRNISGTSTKVRFASTSTLKIKFIIYPTNSWYVTVSDYQTVQLVYSAADGYWYMM